MKAHDEATQDFCCTSLLYFRPSRYFEEGVVIMELTDVQEEISPEGDSDDRTI